MLQEGNASRERLNEFNDLIYCFILYTVYTLFTFDENLHTDIFSLSGDGEQTVYSWTLIVRTPVRTIISSRLDSKALAKIGREL